MILGIFLNFRKIFLWTLQLKIYKQGCLYIFSLNILSLNFQLKLNRTRFTSGSLPSLQNLSGGGTVLVVAEAPVEAAATADK